MSEKTKNAWIINGLLAVILAILLTIYINMSGAKAYAARRRLGYQRRYGDHRQSE